MAVVDFEHKPDPATNFPPRHSSAAFVAGFRPPDYLAQGLLQRRFSYSMTGRTGAGKTSAALRLAACVALGRPFGPHQTKQGRVFYFAGENPDDIRMRWIAQAQHLGVSVDELDVHFFPGRFPISQAADHIRRETDAVGEFSLGIIDTSASYFEGKDENSNVEQARHAAMIRELIGIVPGGPTLLTLAHPPKNAGDDNLLPRGGGAFLAEVDGNLTCSLTGTVAEIHWQGKFRGPDFAPFKFELRSVTHEQLKTSDGHLMPTVIAKPLTDEAEAEIRKVALANEDALLQELAKNGSTSVAELARNLGWLSVKGEPHKSKVHRAITSLRKTDLIEPSRSGGYTVTSKGEKLLEKAKLPEKKVA